MTSDATVIERIRQRWPRTVLGLTSDHLVLLGLLMVSLSANVYLAHRMRTHGRGAENRTVLRAGERLGSIESTRLGDDRPHVLNLAGELPTVVYLYSDSCGWCVTNAPAVTSLHSQAKGRFRFIAISLDDGIGKSTAVDTPLQSLAPPFETYVVKRQNGSWVTRLGGTPSTLVVSRDGTVSDSWAGAFVGNTKRAVEEYFGVRLPDVAAPRRVSATEAKDIGM